MRNSPGRIERVETVVIGGGQAGLSVGYHLARRKRAFVIVEARDRIGDVWRDRWDSLRLFTPAIFSGLDGMPFPAAPFSFHSKDKMADYLESYAAHFSLPVRTGVRVTKVTRADSRFLVTCPDYALEAENVVVAMADYQKPHTPQFASMLDPEIVQLHSYDYRNPAQLRDGPVLIVGAGNSGSEIAMELSRSHEVWMSGRHTGHLPFRIEGLPARLLLIRLVLRVLFHRILTVDTAFGRKARSKILHKGGPLIRVKPRDLDRAGVIRVARTAGVRDGLPLLEDGRTLHVSNVVWCTGFHPGFDWIDIPGFHADDPAFRRRIVDREPGLHFVGRHFLHALSSGMIHGVGRDAEVVAKTIDSRVRRASPIAADLAPRARIVPKQHAEAS
jgi:putative flavoprotein involved in K+ transport